MRIVLTGGGTGGHIIPFEPIVEALRILHVEKKGSLPERIEPEELELKFLGVADNATKAFFASYDIPAIHIPSGKLRRYISHLTLFELIFFVPLGIIKALYFMWKIMPDVVISKGGYGSLPVVLAAFFYRIPVLLHESDSAPGLANLILARFASTIATGFAETKKEFPPRLQHKIVATGTPVRTRFSALDSSAAKRSFGFTPDDTVLLIIGGSQGAQQLNEVVLRNLSFLITEMAIIHVTGDQNFKAVSTLAKELLATSSRREKYKVFSYLDDNIDEAYSAADIIISRAGATTLAELARVRKACILVPLSGAASDHQRKNAAIFELAGAARVLEPTNLSANLFRYNIEELLKDQNMRKSLAANITKLDRPNSAREIAEISFMLARGQVPVYKANI